MDTIDPLRFVFAFAFVLGLIGILALMLKRYGKSQKFFGQYLGVKNEGSRLEVVEVRYLDPRRKLMLVRRDNIEHLLLIGDGRELVIETGIAASMMPPVNNGRVDNG